MERDILKKGSGHLLKTKRVRFEFIKAHAKEFTVEKMAKVLGVSRCGYYEFMRKSPSKRVLEEQKFIEEINKAQKKS